MSAEKNVGDSYAADGDMPSPDLEQPGYFTYDTSEFAAAASQMTAVSTAPETFSDAEEPYDYLKLAMEEMAAEYADSTASPTAEPVAQTPYQEQAASPVPSAYEVQAQRYEQQIQQEQAQARARMQATAVSYAEPNDGAPVNPLVAARASAASAAAGGDGLYPIDETEPEQGQRSFDTSFGERKSHKGAIVVVLLLIALLAAGVYFGYGYLKNRDATARLSSAIERLRDSDAVIIPLDQAIATEIETGLTAEELSELMALSTTTTSILNDAESIVTEAEAEGLTGYLDGEASAALTSVTESVQARRSMIEIGKMLLAADTKAGSALENLNAAYESIASADQRVQWALDSYNGYWNAANNGEDVSDWDLWSIAGMESDAAGFIQSAQESVAAAKEAMPEADLSALDDYLTARAQHIDLLIQIDVALASGDLDTFWGLGDSVNQADAAQSAAAANVPQDPGELLASAYSSMTASQRQAYEAAREACLAADSTINKYLGVSADAAPAASAASGTVAANVADVQEPVTESPAAETSSAGDADQGEGSSEDGGQPQE